MSVRRSHQRLSDGDETEGGKEKQILETLGHYTEYQHACNNFRKKKERKKVHFKTAYLGKKGIKMKTFGRHEPAYLRIKKPFRIKYRNPEQKYYQQSIN